MIRQPDLALAERMACEQLLRYGRLPVCPLTLLKAQPNVSVHTYAEVAELLGQTIDAFEREYPAADAFTYRSGSRWVVAYRSDGNPARRRFTLAHELGHIVLSHGEMDGAAEREADHFASCLLCPAPILEGTPEEIAVRCFVSAAAARMALRREPGLVDEKLLKSVKEAIMTNEDKAGDAGNAKNVEQCMTNPEKGTQT